MQKLSPRYRTDSSDGLPEEIKEYLDEQYFKQLEHLGTEHPKLLIAFSGASAVGKTVLSQRIKSELQALVLENDAVKAHLKTLQPDISFDDLNRLTWQYTTNLYKRLSRVTANGLVVRDGVIDWYYDRILPDFFAQGYQLFTIAYDLSRDKRIELIRKRGDMPNATVDRFIDLIEDNDIHTKRFRAEYAPDIVLHDNNLFEHDPVIDAIRARLETL